MMRLTLTILMALSTLLILGCADRSPVQEKIQGDPQAGKLLMQGYDCGSCHVIPGIPTAKGRMGPKLDHYARRAYVAGVLPNTPEEVARWIVNPQDVDPRTAMPNLGVAPQQARDMAAYLYLKTED